jgi:Tfp pilus assembly protein PilX
MAIEKTRPQMHTSERGVALIMVILVLLVLTVLGITAAMLMTQEDRISSRQDLQKAALYAAEAGLRKGEQVFSSTGYSNSTLNMFLKHVSVARTLAAPDPVPVQPGPWDIRHLGTYVTDPAGVGVEIANREVTQLVNGTQPFNRIRAYYSLYTRNNPEDRNPSTGLQDPTNNFDTRLRLISVGFITNSDGVGVPEPQVKVLAVKIVEEEFNWTGFSQASSAQKLMNAGGTSSGVYSGGG